MGEVSYEAAVYFMELSIDGALLNIAYNFTDLGRHEIEEGGEAKIMSEFIRNLGDVVDYDIIELLWDYWKYKWGCGQWKNDFNKVEIFIEKIGEATQWEEVKRISKEVFG